MNNDGSQSWNVICRRMNKYVNELLEENVKSFHYEEVTTRYGETRCDKTERTNNSTFTFTLNDGCADLLMEVERHSCRRLRREGIFVIQCLLDNDPNTTTSRFSSRR